MWALSVPVRRHCWTNMPCERFITWPVTIIEIGTETSATSASSGRDPEHHRQHREHGEQRGEQLAHRLLQRLADVVDVVGDPAQQLAARLLVEVAQRQPVDLVLDVGAHPQHGALHDVVEQVARRGRPAARRARRSPSTSSSTWPTAAKSTPCPGTTSIEATMLGDLVLAALAQRRPPPAPWSARPAAVRRSARRRSGRWPCRGSAGRPPSSTTLSDGQHHARRTALCRSGRIRPSSRLAEGQNVSPSARSCRRPSGRGRGRRARPGPARSPSAARPRSCRRRRRQVPGSPGSSCALMPPPPR